MIRLLRLWRLTGRDIRLLWFALKHPNRPVWVWPMAIVFAMCAIEPLNFAIPFFGIADDFILLPLALHWMLKLLPSTIRGDFETVPFQRTRPNLFRQ